MSSVLIIDAELENVLAAAILFHRLLLRRIRKHTALLLVVGRMHTAAHVRPVREGRRQRRLAPRNTIAHLYADHASTHPEIGCARRMEHHSEVNPDDFTLRRSNYFLFN